MRKMLGALLLLAVIGLLGTAVDVAADPDGIEAILFDDRGSVRNDALRVAEKEVIAVNCPHDVAQIVIETMKEDEAAGILLIQLLILYGICTVLEGTSI